MILKLPILYGIFGITLVVIKIIFVNSDVVFFYSKFAQSCHL
jgi:hypothetical protein